MHLPDRKRNALQPPARALVASASRYAGWLVWRVAHPADRGPYHELPAPREAARLYWTAADGLRAPVHFLGVRPGAPGEPVLLAHSLGLGPDSFRYGRDSLADALRAAGFAVYLLTHRGDVDAIPPAGRVGGTFDDIVEQDVGPALERVREHSGYPRVHWVGHGLGGQLGLVWAGRTGAEGLASVVALGAPLTFPRLSADRRVLTAALGVLPPAWRVPVRPVARLAAPVVDEETGWIDGLLRDVPGARSRGVLSHATSDLPLGLLRQARQWFLHGALVDRTGRVDYRECLRDACVPLLIGVSEADGVCPAPAGFAALDTWGGEGDALDLDGLGHWDLLFGEAARRDVFPRLAAWLDARRRLAWGDRVRVDASTVAS